MYKYSGEVTASLSIPGVQIYKLKGSECITRAFGVRIYMLCSKDLRSAQVCPNPPKPVLAAKGGIKVSPIRAYIFVPTHMGRVIYRDTGARGRSELGGHPSCSATSPYLHGSRSSFSGKFWEVVPGVSIASDSYLMKSCIASLVLVASSTALRATSPDVAGRSNSGAVLRFRDKKTLSPVVLVVCRQLFTAHKATHAVHPSQCSHRTA